MIQYDSTCLKFSLKYLTGFDGVLSLKMMQKWQETTDGFNFAGPAQICTVPDFLG